ncbi:hypothetical protein H4219_001824 [Mycoemilia scoparia]|uniref:Uncharacterized protein n=1 Tax=Mycoemilia scoparia TaxID=417184 RepID=A0A9W7ZZ82_9FUNG|nr:hypothetical protein H4219_001824 [Mycoemilia scoparia]
MSVTLKVPTIAAIDGPALGGGLEMSLCCDFRFAGPTSVLGLPETSLGIIPGAGGTQRLSRLIGASKAKQLIFTALRFGPEQGRSLGIIDTLFQNGSKFGSGDELHSSTGIEQALKLASSIISQAPLAVKMAKQAIDLGITQELVSGLETEQLCYAPLLDTKDRLEGLQAFKEKRKPIYKGI